MSPVVEPFVDDGEVLVHIGLPKTGTTALQEVLSSSRSALAAAGVLYPGSAPSHVLAAFAPVRWFEATRPEAGVTSAWDDLVAEVAAHRGRAVVSAENLCVADSAAARRVVDGLGGPRARVLVTMRPWHVVLPSFWQHEVRSGSGTPFAEWLDGIVARDGQAAENFWHLFDLGRLVERWADVVGADRVAVLVVDSGRPGGVAGDVAALLGLPDAVWQVADGPRPNRSLTAAEVEIVRRLNVRLAGHEFAWNNPLNGRYVHPVALRELIEGRRPDPSEPRLVVPAADLARLRPIATRSVDVVRSVGVRVVGDLDDLVPSTGDAGPDVPGSQGGDDGQGGHDGPTTVPRDAAVVFLSSLLRVTRPSSTSPDVAPAPVRTAAGAPLVPAPVSRPRLWARRVLPARVRRPVARVVRRVRRRCRSGAA